MNGDRKSTSWYRRGRCLDFFLLALLISRVHALGVTVEEALRQMPVPKSALPLTQETFIPTCLAQFRSNEVVKALVFLPGVADDFYLIHRDARKLAITSDNLLGALTALTNATSLRATFRAPYLFVHADRDLLSPVVAQKNRRVDGMLQLRRSIAGLVLIDRHWDFLQPQLQNGLKMLVTPPGKSEEAWHFARYNLAAFGLTDWELLSALSIAGRTKILPETSRIRFEEGLDFANKPKRFSP